MNFLGHLYFSDNDLDLMIANLFGDFIKGKKYLDYSKNIQKGVVLHRQIDYFIDTHPEVKKLRLKLYNELPKVAGVAIDLYFDHLLAIHWDKYHTRSYKDFLNQFYAYQSTFETELSVDYRLFLGILRTKKWMDHYPTSYGLKKLCEGVSRRISFPNALGKAPRVFENHKIEISKVFHQFMEDAKIEFDSES
jgi:acyl carrier protein phosphodiesterase